MAQAITLSTYGKEGRALGSALTTVGLPVGNIASIEPFTGVQPISGVTILTRVKMRRDGSQHSYESWLSPTATATVITAAG